MVLVDETEQERLLKEAHSIPDAAMRKAAIEAAKAMPIRPAIPHNPCINAGAIMVGVPSLARSSSPN